jgi:Zonular occludens toxin (Zot).
MIIHIAGLPGSGKTYYIVKKIKEWVEGHIDVYLYYQFKINIDTPHIKYWRRLDELVRIKDGIIVIDEAQIFMNARKWEVFPEDLQYKLQQHRKHNLHMWLISQNIRRIDVVARELVQYYYHMRSLFCITLFGKKHELFIKTEYSVDDIEKPDVRKELLGREFVWYNQKIADLYDTTAEQEIEDKDIIEVQYKKCPECGHLSKIGAKY